MCMWLGQGEQSVKSIGLKVTQSGQQGQGSGEARVCDRLGGIFRRPDAGEHEQQVSVGGWVKWVGQG